MKNADFEKKALALTARDYFSENDIFLQDFPKLQCSQNLNESCAL